MTDIVRLLKDVAELQAKLSGDLPIKFDQLKCDLVDANGDRRMHWWTPRDDEFYAAARSLPLAEIAGEVERGRRAIRLLHQLKNLIASTAVTHGHGMYGTLLDFDDKLRNELAALTKEQA